MTTHDSGAHVAELMNMDKSALPADGGERFNRLIFARSPYLLQHAENPVAWYEWCDEAFEKARSGNLPILLSIGYATCHWCHVMAHDCFEDDQVADLLNRHFVCIKVDREERPDIDDFYMTASQVLTGSGGWPLNVFMTPDRRPFFTMTYLPRQRFMELLAGIVTLWQRHPGEVDKNCSAIMEGIERLSRGDDHACPVLAELDSLAFEQLSAIHDRTWGGFGPAPKFPLPLSLGWLAGQGMNGNQEALEMAQKSLAMIRRGGIWDQLGGGVHRYSVDERWLVPHFEKMLYDQALLAMACLDVCLAAHDPSFLAMAEDIFRFVGRELTSAEGAFFSALDADSGGEEGAYYLWTREDIEEILGRDGELFCRFFGVGEKGNFQGQNILHMPVDLETFCAGEDLDPERTGEMLDDCRERLLEYREERSYPLRDEKIITSWNGLMIAALARGGALGGEQEYIESASRAARFILKNLRRQDGRLLRSYLTAPSSTPAFLEDYAFLCFGLIELFEATLDSFWQEQALLLADEMLRIFRDPVRCAFATVGLDAEQMPGQSPRDSDGVLPSPFSRAAHCFIRLGYACDRDDLLDHAHLLLGAPLDDAAENPLSHLGALQALAMLEQEPTIIHFRGQRDSRGIASLLASARSFPLTNLVIRFTESDHEGEALVCAQGSCHGPFLDGSSLEQQLSRLCGQG